MLPAWKAVIGGRRPQAKPHQEQESSAMVSSGQKTAADRSSIIQCASCKQFRAYLHVANNGIKFNN